MELKLVKRFDYWQFVYDEIANDDIYYRFQNAIELIDQNPAQAELIFKDLIRQYPFYLDAYNLLSFAFKIQNKVFESLLTAEKSYNIGRSVFPKDFNFKEDSLVWSILENRPFLNSCQVFGIELQDAGNHSKALEVFEVPLLLNKNDNQGIRYLMFESLIALSDFREAESFLKKNKDDRSLDFLYFKVNLEVVKGNQEKALKYLGNAIKANPFLPSEIIKGKQTKSREPYFFDVFPVGSIQEAYDHWERYKTFYTREDVLGFYRQNSIRK